MVANAVRFQGVPPRLLSFHGRCCVSARPSIHTTSWRIISQRTMVNAQPFLQNYPRNLRYVWRSISQGSFLGLNATVAAPVSVGIAVGQKNFCSLDTGPALPVDHPRQLSVGRSQLPTTLRSAR